MLGILVTFKRLSFENVCTRTCTVGICADGGARRVRRGFEHPENLASGRRAKRQTPREPFRRKIAEQNHAANEPHARRATPHGSFERFARRPRGDQSIVRGKQRRRDGALAGVGAAGSSAAPAYAIVRGFFCRSPRCHPRSGCYGSDARLRDRSHRCRLSSAAAARLVNHCASHRRPSGTHLGVPWVFEAAWYTGTSARSPASPLHSLPLSWHRASCRSPFQDRWQEPRHAVQSRHGCQRY